MNKEHIKQVMVIGRAITSCSWMWANTAIAVYMYSNVTQQQNAIATLLIIIIGGLSAHYMEGKALRDFVLKYVYAVLIVSSLVDASIEWLLLVDPAYRLIGNGVSESIMQAIAYLVVNHLKYTLISDTDERLSFDMTLEKYSHIGKFTGVMLAFLTIPIEASVVIQVVGSLIWMFVYLYIYRVLRTS